MDDMTFTILKVVVSVAMALISAYLIPYIKAKTTKEKQDTISDAVNIAVKAAEQTLNNSTMKKKEVVVYMQKWLADKGLKITEEQLDNLIECVVYEVKQDKKQNTGGGQDVK